MEGEVAVLTIDRPHARNAIGLATMAELGDALDQIENEPVNVLVVRGAGDRAFVSGGDLKELSAIRDEQGAIDMATRMRRLLDRLATFPVPVVGRAQRPRARWRRRGRRWPPTSASPPTTSSIGFTQVQLAIMPAWGGAERLAELVGRSRAMLPHRAPARACPPPRPSASGWFRVVAPRTTSTTPGGSWPTRSPVSPRAPARQSRTSSPPPSRSQHPALERRRRPSTSLASGSATSTGAAAPPTPAAPS